MTERQPLQGPAHPTSLPLLPLSETGRPSHGLKLVNPLLGVALSDLPQRFVFVSARFDVLGVQHVVLRLLAVVSGLGQLGTQRLRDRGAQNERIVIALSMKTKVEVLIRKEIPVDINWTQSLNS